MQRGGHFLYKEKRRERCIYAGRINGTALIAQTATRFVEKEVLPHLEAIEHQDFDTVVASLKKQERSVCLLVEPL
jgi:hypothetical protein